MKVKLALICAPKELQARAGMDEAIVSEYAQAWSCGASFPAIVVFQDDADETVFWLADGFHRHAAAIRAQLDEIECDVRKGSYRDALLYSLGANATHGLRRSTADKRKAVITLLSDPEWAIWSDREIARQAHVDHKTVSVIRRELAATGEFPSSSATDKRMGKDGKLRSNRSTAEFRSSNKEIEKDPHIAFQKLFAEFIAQVPENKRHYVCGQLRTLSWEHDPEAQSAQESLLVEISRKNREETKKQHALRAARRRSL